MSQLKILYLSFSLFKRVTYLFKELRGPLIYDTLIDKSVYIFNRHIAVGNHLEQFKVLKKKRKRENYTRVKIIAVERQS